MVNTGSLVLYKNRLAIISAVDGDRISILIEGGEPKKVRDKDIAILSKGPCKVIPLPRIGGDFETARSMIVSDADGDKVVAISWDELAELVFGDKAPDALVGCVKGVLDSDLFRIVENLPVAQSDAVIAKLRDRELQKHREAELKKNFTTAFSECMRTKSNFDLLSHPEFARFIAELENFARGAGERNALAAECGLAESPELVHQALVTIGVWPPYENPWPARAGCILFPFRLDAGASAPHDSDTARLNLQHLRAFAIDNAWSEDPDDAISIEGDHVWVHVADPAAFFGPGSDIDREALRRGATLYLPEIIVPMLPPAMMGLLGLGLNQVSKALSFKIGIDESGGIRSTEIMPSLLKVTRLSYSQADELLESGDSDLAGLQVIAEKRRARRIANGAVEIDFPEVSMKAVQGDVRFVQVPDTKSSGIVQEMMLLAGEAAARWAWERKLPFTYSSQEAPQFAGDVPKTDSGEKSLSLQFLRRKGMRASIVGTECLAHHGLGLSFYSQVTSPLRRYQDLLAHYQLRAMLLHGSVSDALTEDEIARRCLLAGQAAYCARQAERDSRLHWIAYYLSRNPGWKGQATVLDSSGRETVIFVHDLGMETLVRTRTRPDADTKVEARLVRSVVAMRDIGFELSD